jgi:hypothetical protein
MNRKRFSWGDEKERRTDENERRSAWLFNFRPVFTRERLAKVRVHATVSMVVTRADGTVETIPPPTRLEQIRRGIAARVRWMRN